MNIFWLDLDPKKCAQQHCDKHVVKMVLELCMLLCTAHRVLDGTLIEEEYVTKSNKKRKRKVYKLDNEENQLYKASHVNHPCAIWTRKSDKNYQKTFELFLELCEEYSFRYGKTHKCYTLFHEKLENLPENIPKSDKMSTPVLCMPDEYKVESVTESYQNYYRQGKKDIATWDKNRAAPAWFDT